MEQLIAKLKTNAIITLILGILSLTWVLIDYFVAREFIARYEIGYSLEYMLVIISAVAILIFHISVFIGLYYIFRLQVRYKSEKKKKKETTPEETGRLTPGDDKENDD